MKQDVLSIADRKWETGCCTHYSDSHGYANDVIQIQANSWPTDEYVTLIALHELPD